MEIESILLEAKESTLEIIISVFVESIILVSFELNSSLCSNEEIFSSMIFS